jgi:hypothetical protein
MAVDGRAADAELGGDLRDRVPALTVPTSLVIHLPRELHLSRPKLGLLTSSATSRAGGGEPVHRPFGHQCMLEFRNCPDDLEEQPPHGGRGVDPLVQHHEIYVAALQELGELDEVLQGSSEPVELGDDQLVAGAVGDQERLV